MQTIIGTFQRLQNLDELSHYKLLHIDDTSDRPQRTAVDTDTSVGTLSFYKHRRRTAPVKVHRIDGS